MPLSDISAITKRVSMPTTTVKPTQPTIPFVPALIISLFFSILLIGVTTQIYEQRLDGSGDFAWPLHGARLLVAGVDPYGPEFVIPSTYDQEAPLYYPLPAVLLIVPLAGLPNALAGGIFIGLSSGLLAFALLRTVGLSGLIVFLTPFYFAAVLWGQWSPLICAVALLPSAMPAALAKPSLGLASFLYAPSLRGAVACCLFILLSILILPSWIPGWLNNIAENRHFMPLLILPAPLVLLALRYWKNREARLLIVLTCVPQRLQFADQLLLVLVARTIWDRIIFVVGGWTALIFTGVFFNWKELPMFDLHQGSQIDAPGFAIVLFVYIPALYMVLRDNWKTNMNQPTTTRSPQIFPNSSSNSTN
jgi:hypothetical protein